MKFHVYHAGNPALGIPGATAVVQMGLDDDLEGQERQDQIEHVKDYLRQCFGAIWGCAWTVTVNTQDEELAAQAAFLEDNEDKKFDFTPVYKEESTGNIWGYFTPKEK